MLSENAIAVSLLSYLCKFRLIVVIRGHDIILYDNNIINKFLFQRLLNKAEKIISPSKPLFSIAEKETMYFFDKTKCKVIPNWIELPEFDKKISTLILPKDKQYIFGCGNLNPDKGFDILIKGFEQISKKYLNIDLVIAGDGEERRNLELLSQNLNISDRIHFRGFIKPEEIASYFQGCLFLVVPSRFDVFPNVILEAMSVGKVVIASNIGGMPEIVKDDFNGFLFENENYEILAERMKFLIENRNLLEYMGHNARMHVEKYYRKDIIELKIAEMIFS